MSDLLLLTFALGWPLALLVFYGAAVELTAWLRRPRGIPTWPDLRRTKDLKRWTE